MNLGREICLRPPIRSHATGARRVRALPDNDESIPATRQGNGCRPLRADKSAFSAELVRTVTGLICCREKEATQLWEVQGQRQTWVDCEIRATILFQVIPQEQLHDVLRSCAFDVSQIALPRSGAIRVLHNLITWKVIHIRMRIGPLLGDCS